MIIQHNLHPSPPTAGSADATFDIRSQTLTDVSITLDINLAIVRRRTNPASCYYHNGALDDEEPIRSMGGHDTSERWGAGMRACLEALRIESSGNWRKRLTSSPDRVLGPVTKKSSFRNVPNVRFGEVGTFRRKGNIPTPGETYLPVGTFLNELFYVTAP